MHPVVAQIIEENTPDAQPLCHSDDIALGTVVRHAQTNLPGEFLGRPGDDVLAGLSQRRHNVKSLAASGFAKACEADCI